jgi:hypothetical protein
LGHVGFELFGVDGLHKTEAPKLPLGAVEEAVVVLVHGVGFSLSLFSGPKVPVSLLSRCFR